MATIPGGINIPVLAGDPTDSPDTGKIFIYTVGDELRWKNNAGNVFVASTGVTAEQVEDIIGAAFQDGNGTTFQYNDGAGTLSIDIESGLLALINSALQPGDNVSALANDANYIDAGGAPVQSVNGLTGNVIVGFTKYVEWFTNNVSFTNNQPTFISVYTWNTPPLLVGTYLFEVILAYEPGATNNNDMFRLAEGTTELSRQVRSDDEGKDTGGDIEKTIVVAGELIVTAAGSKTLNLRGAQRGDGTTVVKGAVMKLEQYA